MNGHVQQDSLKIILGKDYDSKFREMYYIWYFLLIKSLDCDQYLVPAYISRHNLAEKLNAAINVCLANSASLCADISNALRVNLVDIGTFNSFDPRDVRESLYIYNIIYHNYGMFKDKSEPTLDQVFNNPFEFNEPKNYQIECSKSYQISCVVSILDRISDFFEKSVFLLDVISQPIQEKESALSRAVSSWNNHLYKTKKYYEWFSDKEYMESRTNFSLDWIKKNIGNASGDDLDLLVSDPHTKLLIILDELHWKYPDFSNQLSYLRLSLDKLKKSWSQYNYRESLKSGNKKQCNFLLTKNTIQKLDKLSEQHLMGRADIVEKLIRDAYEKGLNLNNK